MSGFLARPERVSGRQSLTNLASSLLIAALIILFLYLGRDILEPLVVAALLGFILAPLIRRLRNIGLWRVPSVLLTVLFAIAALAALGATIALQVTQLADDLPNYEVNLRTKIRALGPSGLTSGALERASGTLKQLQKEIARPEPSVGAGQRPLVVEVRQPEARGLGSVVDVARPLLSPLGTTALAILFLMFILLQREDIRDRFLRLAGTADLQRTTAALDDAATRLSRFFLMQTLLNAGFGIFIGTGLWLIGVPNAVLWGILAGLMRFVPFVGTVIAAFFPVALAAAVDPGWTMVLATAALFIVAEPTAGQIIEPVLYGQHTGLSPVAVVVSTLFWALLWGPIGLLLATPLTVCLVVLGRHIDALAFIDVLLGDEPALEAHQRFYQRLLADDATEAADQAEQQLKKQSLSAYYDGVPMRALSLAQADAVQGKLPREKQIEIRDTMAELVENLSDYDDVDPLLDERKDDDAERAGIEPGKLPAPIGAVPVVLCIPSRSPLDEAAAELLAQLLGKHGLAAAVQPFADVASIRTFKIDASAAPFVCLSYFGAVANPAHVRYLVRRLRRVMPNARVLAGFWMLGDDPHRAEEWRAAVGAQFVATSLRDAVAICMRETGSCPRDTTTGSVPNDARIGNLVAAVNAPN